MKELISKILGNSKRFQKALESFRRFRKVLDIFETQLIGIVLAHDPTFATGYVVSGFKPEISDLGNAISVDSHS